MSNTTERAFFGEISEADSTLGLASYDGSASYTASSYTLSAGSGNDYLIIGVYDFSTRVLQTKAFSTSDSIPGPEPLTWDAEVTLDVGRIVQLDGIRMVAGASSGTPGNCYFDEVRVATSWANLVNRLEVRKTRKRVPTFFLRGLR